MTGLDTPHSSLQEIGFETKLPPLDHAGAFLPLDHISSTWMNASKLILQVRFACIYMLACGLQDA
jgi:hypothetical protein